MKISKLHPAFWLISISTRGEWDEIGRKAGWTRPEQAATTTDMNGMSNAGLTYNETETTEIEVDDFSDATDATDDTDKTDEPDNTDETDGMEIEVVFSCDEVSP